MHKGLSDIMKQAKKMQEKMEEIQKGLAEKCCEASVGGGMVTARVNGNLQLVSIKIDPSVVNPEDVELLEDLIVAAVGEATKRAQDMVAQEMGKVTMGFNIPGIFGR